MTCVMSCKNKNSSYWDKFGSRETKFISRVSGKSQLSEFQLLSPSVRFQLKSACPRYNFEQETIWHFSKTGPCKLSLLYVFVSISSEFPLYTEFKFQLLISK